MTWLYVVLAFFLGGTLGALAMALAIAADDRDDPKPREYLRENSR